MNKNIFAVLMTLFVVFVGFQFAEPAAAVKVVDHGTKYGWDGQDDTWAKLTWKTYQYNNNFLKIYRTFYTKNSKTKKYVLNSHESFTLAKVTKNSIKITYRSDAGIGPVMNIYYDKTKLTAAQYYWRVFRQEITAI
jgi:hypothetical protein